MGAGMLRSRLADLGVCADVESAGLLESGSPVAGRAVRLLAARGVDIAGHFSRRLDAEIIGRATFVVGMEPRHAQEAALVAPDAWPKTFVLEELVRRSEAIGPRTTEPLEAWRGRLHLGRSPEDLLRAGDGVPDPFGRSDDAYRDTIEVLDRLLGRFADLAWRRA